MCARCTQQDPYESEARSDFLRDLLGYDSPRRSRDPRDSAPAPERVPFGFNPRSFTDKVQLLEPVAA